MNNYIEYFDEKGNLLLKTEGLEGTGHDWRLENALSHGLQDFSHYVIGGMKEACLTKEVHYTANGIAIWREVDDNNVLLPYDGRFDDTPPYPDVTLLRTNK